MEPRTERLLLILADISGYTKFMLASQVALIHGQQVITALIEAILAEVAIPLEVKEVEGDAVFLYSVRPRDDEAWQEVSAEVGRKLLRFFEAFSAVLVAESESTLCPCAVCKHMHELKLKIIVHSGEALFHTIGDIADVSGVDVILAHRLLKNSVDADEYILMTKPAYRDLRFPSELEVHKSSEEYEGFGSIDDLRSLSRRSLREVAPELFFRRHRPDSGNDVGRRAARGSGAVQGAPAGGAARCTSPPSDGRARSGSKHPGRPAASAVDADPAAAVSAVGECALISVTTVSARRRHPPMMPSKGGKR